MTAARKDDADQFQTVEKCDRRHGNVNKTGVGIFGVVVAIIAAQAGFTLYAARSAAEAAARTATVESAQQADAKTTTQYRQTVEAQRLELREMFLRFENQAEARAVRLETKLDELQKLIRFDHKPGGGP